MKSMRDLHPAQAPWHVLLRRHLRSPGLSAANRQALLATKHLSVKLSRSQNELCRMAGGGSCAVVTPGWHEYGDVELDSLIAKLGASEECKLAATGHLGCFGRSRSRSPLLQKKGRSRKAGASGQLAGELKGPGRWSPLMAWDWPLPGSNIGRSFFLDWPLITSKVHKKSHYLQLSH